jgi:hypothetical protein
MYPVYPPDPTSNPFVTTDEQMNFIFVHYPDYYRNPIELMCWLYDMALIKETQSRPGATDDDYKTKPLIGSRPVNKKKKNDLEEDEEDTFYGSKPKKPLAKPSVLAKEIPFEVLEARRN